METITLKDAYDTFGLEETATQDQIDFVYHCLASKVFPIRHRNPEAEKAFIGYSVAYTLLSDQEGKKEFYLSEKGTTSELSDLLHISEDLYRQVLRHQFEKIFQSPIIIEKANGKLAETKTEIRFKQPEL